LAAFIANPLAALEATRYYAIPIASSKVLPVNKELSSPAAV